MSDSSAATPLSERARWEAFWVCASVAALTILDLSKINVGLPSIEASLRGGPTELQLIVAGYALAFGLALVPAGRLGDIHSRKIMFVIGLSAFTLASLVCAIAPSIEVLVIGRIVQGFAAGIQMPQALGLIQQLFQGPARGRAFGLFGAVIGISTAFGPTLGGLLIAIGGDTDGWRLLFWMNIPLGIVALIYAVRLLPAKQVRTAGRTELDITGILLLGITTFFLMIPFVLTTGGPDDDPRRWFFLIGAVIGAAAFAWWERRYERLGRSPVVNFALFKHASYRNGILIGTAYFAAVPATFLLVTIYLQQGLGLAAVFAGMVSIPFALVSAWASWIGGRHVDQLGRVMVLLGVLLVAAGVVLFIPIADAASPDAVPWLFAAAMILAGAGGGLVISPNQTLTLQDVPVIQGGVAGSVAQVGQRVGTAVGVAIASSTFFATLYSEADTALDQATIYGDAFGRSMLVVLGLLAVALLFALLDLRSGRVTGRRTVLDT
ncbi:MFS transporter [Salinibacterium sp. ZJ454]|uniref:MFS transporter n=1 Tax=Salinibacterium sp. ZJ454 TaxID=2708339 RepID=UPI00142476AD|nr:MFS transporter [Salinibacterium sp. ZJ454]